MQIIRTANEMTSLLEANQSVGFVPTMGALHEGHLALIKKSRSKNSCVVCSIFVNPAQFNDKADFEKYPNDLQKDIQVLSEAQVDYLFLPTVEEVYPSWYPTKEYALGLLDSKWEAAFRPGHFQGVCKVMDRLLDIVPTNDLWMGQKDFQQCLVVQRLLELTHRDKVRFQMIATVRNAGGLALSSRNQRLSEQGKINAQALYESLQMIQKSFHFQEFDFLQKIAVNFLISKGFEKVEYIDIIQKEPEMIVAAAAWIEGVRLIDNINFH